MNLTNAPARKRPIRAKTLTRSTFSRRSLHGQTASLLGSLIVNGEIAEGSVLPPESELTAALDCSRSVLREAILVLTSKGMLESRQKLGTRVKPRIEWNLLDPDVIDWVLASGERGAVRKLMELRAAVEPSLARIAAERASDAGIAEIEAALRNMEASVNSLEAFIPHDLAFHEHIAKASDNEFLGALSNVIRDSVLTTMIVLQVPEKIRKSRLELHRAVCEAIAARDGDRAATAMRRLVEEANTDIENVLKQTKR